MQNFGMSMLWFWVCYAIVTCVGILHTIFNIYVLKMKPMDENSMGEGYEKTKPWHPLYNIILFSLFGWLYMNGLTEPSLTEALITAFRSRETSRPCRRLSGTLSSRFSVRDCL